jgi:hypothetical protein
MNPSLVKHWPPPYAASHPPIPMCPLLTSLPRHPCGDPAPTTLHPCPCAAGVNVLVDPWLVDDLVFGDLPWLFRGKKRMLAQGAVDVAAVAAATDVLLITQVLLWAGIRTM